MTVNTPNRGYSNAIAAYATGYDRGLAGCTSFNPPFLETQQEWNEFHRGLEHGWKDERARDRAHYKPKSEDQLRAEDEAQQRSLRDMGART